MRLRNKLLSTCTRQAICDFGRGRLSTASISRSLAAQRQTSLRRSLGSLQKAARSGHTGGDRVNHFPDTGTGRPVCGFTALLPTPYQTKRRPRPPPATHTNHPPSASVSFICTPTTPCAPSPLGGVLLRLEPPRRRIHYLLNISSL